MIAQRSRVNFEGIHDINEVLSLEHTGEFARAPKIPGKQNQRLLFSVALEDCGESVGPAANLRFRVLSDFVDIVEMEDVDWLFF